MNTSSFTERFRGLFSTTGYDDSDVDALLKAFAEQHFYVPLVASPKIPDGKLGFQLLEGKEYPGEPVLPAAYDRSTAQARFRLSNDRIREIDGVTLLAMASGSRFHLLIIESKGTDLISHEMLTAIAKLYASIFNDGLATVIYPDCLITPDGQYFSRTPADTANITEPTYSVTDNPARGERSASGTTIRQFPISLLIFLVFGLLGLFRIGLHYYRQHQEEQVETWTQCMAYLGIPDQGFLSRAQQESLMAQLNDPSSALNTYGNDLYKCRDEASFWATLDLSK